MTDTHVTIPADLLAEIRDDLEAEGDRAKRWRQPTPHKVIVLTRGEDAWPVGWVGTLADVTDWAGRVTGSDQPHPAAAAAWAPVGSVDGASRPDKGDRVLVLADSGGACPEPWTGNVSWKVLDSGPIRVLDPDDESDHPEAARVTRWAILPPAQPTPGEASPPDKPHQDAPTSPARRWRLGQAWAAHDGPMVTIAEEGTGPADEQGRRADDRLVGAMGREDAERAVAAVNHTRGDAEALRTLRGAVTAAASVGDPHALNVQLRSTLREIVNVLGPDRLCDCAEHDDCGLRAEVAEALRIATEALEAPDA